ncbi:hypothetical protein UK23_19645 [Lentzea aerocolonigenes]|uniref:Uncharacterized protein n=1 Tax=Lentzea aerocolonigenes TaxID=68170 RepID=A0A0F0GYM3_LENAE|nr:hypothetical protein [Lentzea aerocolonigenes]KJK47686.1 hypothetical protein UK23_19645 [Lentzea aerocolonigenes]
MNADLAARVNHLNVEWADYSVEPDRAVWLACDFLIEGLDTPALRELAGESPTRLSRGDATSLVRQFLDELGIEPITGEQADWFLGREAALRILGGAPPSEWGDDAGRINMRMDDEDESVYVALALHDTNPNAYLAFVREYLRLAEAQLTGW